MLLNSMLYEESNFMQTFIHKQEELTIFTKAKLELAQYSANNLLWV